MKCLTAGQKNKGTIKQWLWEGNQFDTFLVQSSLKKVTGIFCRRVGTPITTKHGNIRHIYIYYFPLKLERADEVLVLRYVVNEILKLPEVGTAEFMEDWKNTKTTCL